MPTAVARRRQQLDGHAHQQTQEPKGAGAPLDPGRHRSWSSRALHRLGDWSSRAAAGVVVACVVAAWMVVGVVTGFPSWWQTVLYSTTASITVVMVFAIQHTQRREQMVIQRKLDELLRAQPEADDMLIAAEGATDDELDALAGLNVADRRLAASPNDRDRPSDHRST